MSGTLEAVFARNADNVRHLAERFNWCAGEVTDTAPLDGLEGFGAHGAACDLWDNMGLEVPWEVSDEWQTVGDVVRYVEGHHAD